MTCSERQQGMRHRSTAAAGAELNDPVASHIRQFAPEAFRKAPPIRIVPHPAAVFQHDRIDGSDRRCIGREFVQERDDGSACRDE